MEGKVFSFPKKIDGEKIAHRFSQIVADRIDDSNIHKDDLSNSIKMIHQSKIEPSKIKRDETRSVSQKKLNKNGLPSIKSEITHNEKRKIQHFDYSDNSISEDFNDDYYDYESSNSFLSSSSSTDEIENVLGDKVENAIYDIYGEDVPQSAIKEITDSISLLLKEQVDQLPENPGNEHDSESAYSDLGSDNLDAELEYSSQEKDYYDADLDIGSEYSDLEQDKSNLGSEYSDLQRSGLLSDYSDLDFVYSESERDESDNSFMSYGPEYDDSEQLYEEDSQELSESQIQALQEQQIKMIQDHQIQMQIMQDQQYQLQLFQYGVPLKKKPIRIYTKRSTNLQQRNQQKLKKVNVDTADPTDFNIQKKVKVNKPKLANQITKEKKAKTKNKLITLNDFNKLPLKSQHTQIIDILSSLSKSNDRSAFTNLSNLIQFLMKFDNISETAHYLEIFNETENDDSIKITEYYPKSKRIYFCYNLTELIRSNDSLKSSELNNILSGFEEIIAEIVYPSPSFDTLYSYFTQHKISIGIFIRNIAKTDNKFKQNKIIRSVKLDSTVKMISDSSFEGCRNIKKVAIPSSVTIIGNSAFSDCKLLRHILIPSSVSSIGEFAFCDSGLCEICIPSTLTAINNSVFRECQNLKHVTIPNSVTKILNYAFFYCGMLEKISLPPSITFVEESAFQGSPANSDIPASLIKKSIGSKEGNSKWKSQKKSSLKSQLFNERENGKQAQFGKSWPTGSSPTDDDESAKNGWKALDKTEDKQNTSNQERQGNEKGAVSVSQNKDDDLKFVPTNSNDGAGAWGNGQAASQNAVWSSGPAQNDGANAWGLSPAQNDSANGWGPSSSQNDGANAWGGKSTTWGRNWG